LTKSIKIGGERTTMLVPVKKTRRFSATQCILSSFSSSSSSTQLSMLRSWIASTSANCCRIVQQIWHSVSHCCN